MGPCFISILLVSGGCDGGPIAIAVLRLESLGESFDPFGDLPSFGDLEPFGERLVPRFKAIGHPYVILLRSS